MVREKRQKAPLQDIDFFDLVELPAKQDLTPQDIQAIRRSVARSCKEFERRFQVPARTMEALEQGRRRPDSATRALLIIIAREPDAAKRALSVLAPWTYFEGLTDLSEE